MKRFEFTWRHAPTCASGKKHVYAFSRERALAKINEWNHSADWKYILTMGDEGVPVDSDVQEFYSTEAFVQAARGTGTGSTSGLLMWI